MALNFTYSEASAGFPGAPSDIRDPGTINTAVSSEPEGISSGNMVFRIPPGGGPGVPTYGNTMPRVERRTRGAGRKPAGFVAFVPGKPGEATLQEYQQSEAAPLCVQGRRWVRVENLGGADPTALADSFFARFANSPGLGAAFIPGNIRYNSDDRSDPLDFATATCMALPQGVMRVIRYVSTETAGISLALVEFDFRGRSEFA